MTLVVLILLGLLAFQTWQVGEYKRGWKRNLELLDRLAAAGVITYDARGEACYVPHDVMGAIAARSHPPSGGPIEASV